MTQIVVIRANTRGAHTKTIRYERRV